MKFIAVCRARSPARWLVVNLSRYLSVGWDRFYKQGRFDTIGGPGWHWIPPPPPLSCAPIGAYLRDPPRGLTSERSPQIPFNQGLADAYLELFRHWFSSLQSLSGGGALTSVWFWIFNMIGLQIYLIKTKK